MDSKKIIQLFVALFGIILFIYFFTLAYKELSGIKEFPSWCLTVFSTILATNVGVYLGIEIPKVKKKSEIFKKLIIFNKQLDFTETMRQILVILYLIILLISLFRWATLDVEVGGPFSSDIVKTGVILPEFSKNLIGIIVGVFYAITGIKEQP